MTETSESTSIVIPTSKEALLQHDGHPVPWVARWSGEVSRDAAQLQVHKATGALRIYYADGKENREESGILWIREGLNRSGEPQYADLNSYRQRASMSRGICQVCGSKITKKPIQWLLDRRQLEILEDGSAVTTSPPTCASCVPLALDICPNFKRSGYVVVSVLEYRIWGVEGEVVVRGAEDKIRQVPGMRVSYEQTNVHQQVVAKNLVAQFTKFKITEEHTP